MEALQGISQLNNQPQHQASPPLHSHPSIDSDELVQILAQELENLVLSCSHEPSDRDLRGCSGDEDRMKQEEIDDEVVDAVVKEAVEEEPVGSSNGSEETTEEEKEKEKEKQSVDEVIEPESLEKVLEVDPKECRVLEEVEVAVSGLGCGNQDDEADDGDGDDDDVKLEEKLNGNENQDEGVETEIEIGDGIGGLGNDSEEERVQDGDDGEYDHVEDLEDESENGGGSMNVPDDGRLKSFHYPLRPDAEDCSYYMRTGMCKFGSNCKFNHPLRRKHQPAKETQKHKEESRDVQGQIECKYYLSSAGCKYGKACKFNHGRGKTVVTPVVEYNFLGLPIRPGEKECPYYMRNGSCKYGPSCRFNHPDPSAAAGSDSPTTYANDGPLPLQPPPQPNIPNMPSWSGPRAPEPTTTFVPVMYPPTQNMPPPNPDWNGYQAPAAVPVHVYPNNERGLPIPPAFFLNNPPSDKNMYTHQQPMTVTHQQPMPVSEYPERPGQPECSYFMKTGDCKYRASCKFHHPKSRITRSTRSVLSDKGLPLRPDQSICTYYSRYGICKYGPACKYDHPVNYNNSNTGRVGGAGEGYDGSDWGGPMVQQSV